MNEFQGNIYRCPNCTRVTTNYPFGCRNKGCPVKKDMLWDSTYGVFVLFVLVFIMFSGLILLNRDYEKNKSSVPVTKELDFQRHRQYTK